MSTHAKIIMKVPEEYKGMIVKFNKSLLPIELKEWYDKDDNGKVWLDQRGGEKSECVELKGDYIGIYCHWDGDKIGKVLKELFTDKKALLNLIVGGHCSYIEHYGVRHYANRDFATTWSEIKPIQGSREKVEESIYGHYEYLFVNTWTKRKVCKK